MICLEIGLNMCWMVHAVSKKVVRHMHACDICFSFIWAPILPCTCDDSPTLGGVGMGYLARLASRWDSGVFVCLKKSATWYSRYTCSKWHTKPFVDYSHSCSSKHICVVYHVVSAGITSCSSLSNGSPKSLGLKVDMCIYIIYVNSIDWGLHSIGP